MPQVRFFVRHGGEWAKDGEEYNYQGGNVKGLVVDSEITFKDMLEKMYSVVKLSPEEFSMKLQCAYKFLRSVPLYEISDDESLRFYLIGEDVLQVPLCISVERLTPLPIMAPVRCSMEAVRESGTGSNHVQPVVSLVPLDKNINSAEDGDYSGTHEILHDDLCEITCNDDEVMNEGKEKRNQPEALQESENLLDPETQPKSQRRKKVKYSIVPLDNQQTPPSNRKSRQFRHLLNMGSPPKDDVEEGQLFSSKRELYCKLSVIAMKKNFEFRVKKSSKELFFVVCTEENCDWRLRSTKLKGLSLFIIGKYHNVHTCSPRALNHGHRQASSRVIEHIIKSKYEGIGQQIKPHDIIEDMRREYGVNISYEKAWRAREGALTLAGRSLEKSYDILASYCEALKIKNPGTVTHIELDNDNHFKYFFMALGSCIHGLHGSIRPVIVFDEICLKGKYRGTLLIGACIDGNNQMYPLAFAIGDRETDQLWGWFLDKLNGAIGNVNELVLISDMKSSILNAVGSLFPSAIHGTCTYYLSVNLKMKFKNDTITTLFLAAAKAYRESEFQKFMSQITMLDGDAAKYLEEVGFQKWARAYYTSRRYNILTINIIECLNSILGDSKEMSITTLIEQLRLLLERWFLERQDEASKITTHLTPYAEEILQGRHIKSLTMHVSPIDCYKSHVKDGYQDEIVNIHTRECSCREFDLDQLPCAHALAVARDQNINPYSLCSPYYTKELLISAYAEPILRVGDISEYSDLPSHISGTILPPKVLRKPGRRRKEEVSSNKEDSTTHKCGRCGGAGHNRKTCQNPPSSEQFDQCLWDNEGTPLLLN